jgi:ATP-dependent DNA helicase RecG
MITDAPLSADKGAPDRLKGHFPVNSAPLNDLQSQILEQIRQKADISYDELASVTGKDRSTVRRNVGKLKDKGLLRRIGSKKTGHWEVL